MSRFKSTCSNLDDINLVNAFDKIRHNEVLVQCESENLLNARKKTEKRVY